MVSFQVLLSRTSVALFVTGGPIFAGSLAHADYAFADAEAAFQRKSVDDRVRLQLLLTAGGYLYSVPMAEFSHHAFEGIRAFQVDNGFQTTGELESDPNEIVRLRKIGDEYLDFWGFNIIQHPSSEVRIWIPGNLGLNRHSTRYGYVYDDPAKRIGIQFVSFPNLNITTSLKSSLKWFDKQRAHVHYKIFKENWYVVSASTPDGQDWYVRYHQDGAATTGFSVAWNNSMGKIYGERIAILMSASLWADRTGAPTLTPRELREGQAPPEPDVASRQMVTPVKPEPPEPQTMPEKKGFSTGTGFFVDDAGDLLTNNHVIEDCHDIKVRMPNKALISAKAIAHDAVNDLALLKVNGPAPKSSTFRPDVKLGEPVAAFGFPHADVMSSSGSFTLGSVTSMSGLHDDSRYVQISAPVQAGNSGGPLFDYDGNTIGMVSAKLNAIKMAIETEDLPQNVNFAIKGYVIASFLDANKIKTSLPDHHDKPLETTAIAEIAQSISVFVVCH